MPDPGDTRDTRGTIAARCFEAHNAIERRHGRPISNALLGKWIAEREGRRDAKGKIRPYTSQAVARWKSGERVPDYGQSGALAELAGLHKGYMGYGELPVWAHELPAVSVEAHADIIPIPVPGGAEPHAPPRRGPRELPREALARVETARRRGTEKPAHATKPARTGRTGSASPRGGAGKARGRSR